MTLTDRINALQRLGKYLLTDDDELMQQVNRAYLYNNWFTKENSLLALRNIATDFLNADKLKQWTESYPSIVKNELPSKIIGIVCAGNIPFVSFHDILCVLICGHTAQIKLSEKDKEIPLFVLEQLIKIEPNFAPYIQITPILANFNAIIATGSNQSAQHFKAYFSKYDHIIRHHRNSIAILTGDETDEELRLLAHDVFDFFGLGCRNVSKIFITEHYDFSRIIKHWQFMNDVLMNHNSYRNNLDYQRTVYLMKQKPMLDIDFVNIVEDESLYSPISCLHYSYYKHEEEITRFEQAHSESIQCIIGKNYLPFGSSQQPALNDYADHVDTLKFLTELN